MSEERLRAILDRVVAYPADHWSGDPEDRKARRLAEVAARETLSPVERLEIMLHPWVGFVIMPLFAFANAGVPISAGDLRTHRDRRFLRTYAREALGVITFSWLAVRSGIAVRPPSLDWGMVAGGGMLAGIGAHDGVVHCKSGVRRRSPQRREVGDPVGIGRLRGAGYGAAGLVVFQYTRGGVEDRRHQWMLK